MQYINEDGTKRFAKGSQKSGALHAIGGIETLKQAPAIVISEGYATAATVAESLGHATVAAFDSGNLKSVAVALREAFPDKPILIAGDDDANQEKNPGKWAALNAAKEVGGKAVFPTFTKNDLATAEQKDIRPTDFNDLAQVNPEGKGAVKRQVTNALEILKTRTAQAQTHTQDQVRERPKEAALAR